MKYDVDYFIRKFEAIPEDQWCEGELEENGKHCADGFCGSKEQFCETRESMALAKMFKPLLIDVPLKETIFTINDGFDECPYDLPTPKQRILAALQDIKKQQHPQEKEPKIVIKYVSVPQTINEQVKKLILS